MSEPLVLITGASGMIGFRILIRTLEAGYRVRAALRSQSKIDEILASSPIESLAPGPKLSFVLVPDILVEGAYTEALKGITHVIHVASPLPMHLTNEDYESGIVQPAVKGTTNMLVAASKTPSVKRIVITSSVAAVVPRGENNAPDYSPTFTTDNVVSTIKGPYQDAGAAYYASKTNALNATNAFMKREKPAFDVINVMPSYVIGRNDLAHDAKGAVGGTNIIALGHVLGTSTEEPRSGTSVLLDDVAKIHVLSLDPKVKGGQNFGANVKVVWNDANEIVKKHFPEAVKDGRLPATGTVPTSESNFIVEQTEKVLGFKFRSFEDQVVEVAAHYLELLGKSG